MPRRPTGKRLALPDGTVTVRGKAPNRAGSVYAVDGGAAWRATWHDAEGRRRYVQAKTRALAIERRDTAIAADRSSRARAGGDLPGDATLDQFARWWLRVVAAQRVRPSSLGKYDDRVERICAHRIARTPLRDLRPDAVATFLADIARRISPSTVKDTRTTLRQILEHAVELDVLDRNPVDRVRGPKVDRQPGRSLSVEDARKLLVAAAGDRLGAAVWLLFCQGWRVSEVCGLAWSDVDLRAGTATIRRAAVYVDGAGTVLGPPKTTGVQGVHRLAPGVVEQLVARREAQEVEREYAGDLWETVTYDGRPVPLVFTTLTGRVVNRQAVTKAVARAAVAAGLDPHGLGTHAGRRTVVTALYSAEGIDLADIARHVGHADPSTTAGYVTHLGARPERTAAAAARILGQPAPRDG